MCSQIALIVFVFKFGLGGHYIYHVSIRKDLDI